MAHVSIPTYSATIPQRYALIGSKCKKCGEIAFPPSEKCGCGSTEFEKLRLSGKGAIYTYTIISRGSAPPEFSEQQRLFGSFPVAIVELVEGPKIITQLTDCDSSDVKIGMKVEMVFRRIYEDEGIIRYGFKFKPTSD